MFQLEMGDIFVAYTDGVTESENSAGIAFGQNRLKAILHDCQLEDPNSILRLILDELSAHSAGCPQTDDITVMVIRVEGADLKNSRTRGKSTEVNRRSDVQSSPRQRLTDRVRTMLLFDATLGLMSSGLSDLQLQGHPKRFRENTNNQTHMERFYKSASRTFVTLPALQICYATAG